MLKKQEANRHLAKKEALFQDLTLLLENITRELAENKTATCYEILEKDLDAQWIQIQEQHTDLLVCCGNPGEEYMVKHHETRKKCRDIVEKLRNKIKT